MGGSQKLESNAVYFVESLGIFNKRHRFIPKTGEFGSKFPNEFRASCAQCIIPSMADGQ